MGENVMAIICNALDAVTNEEVREQFALLE